MTVLRRGPLPYLLLALALAVFYSLAVPLRATHGSRVNGDEPFYLLTTVSLLYDGDLDLTNDYALERYRPFFDHEDPLWRQSVPTGDGRLLSPHNTGLSLLILPAYAIGGLDLVKSFLAVLGGLTIGLTAVLARRITGALGPSLLAAGLMGIGPPLFVYSSQVYPEAPAALIVTGCACLLTAGRPNGPTAVIVALGVTAILWLGVKYAPIGAVLSLATLVATGLRLGASRLSASGRAVWTMTGAATRRPTVTGSLPLTLRTPPGVAEPIPPRDGRPGIPPGLLFLLVLTPLLGVYVWFHFRAFGALTPYAVNLVYAGNTDLELVARHFEVVDRLYRLAGLWVDGEFGLVRWAPVLLLALPGIPLLFARATPGHLLLPALIATQWCMAVFFSITMRGWWFPGRMMIAVLPLLAVPLALAFCRHPQRLRVPAAGLGLLTLGATLTLWAETRSEAIVLAVDPFALQWPLFRLTAPLFPVYTEYTPSTWLLTGLWVLVAAALLIYGARCGRTPPGDGAVAGPPSDTSRVPMVASR